MANISFCELRRKEVINLRDGARLGAVCDLEVDHRMLNSCARAAEDVGPAEER